MYTRQEIAEFPLILLERKASSRVFLEQYFLQSGITLTPEIEQVSVDECFLDYTTIASRFSSPEEGAAYIRNYIYEHFGFTVNVGISSNKVLAKMASDFEKPDKTHTLFPDEIQEKMWPLPISSLFYGWACLCCRPSETGNPYNR